MPQYYTIIRPHRKDFLTNTDEREMEIMGDHFTYLKDLLAEGKLIMAGPTLVETDPFGVIIFETDTEQEARQLLENDPSVKAGIQEIDDLRPIRVSLLRTE